MIYLDNAATTKTAPEVVDAMKKYDGVYFGAIGGAGALLAKCIKKAELIAYEDLGPEAVVRLEVKDMPLFVINDIHGNTVQGPLSWLKGDIKKLKIEVTGLPKREEAEADINEQLIVEYYSR